LVKFFFLLRRGASEGDKFFSEASVISLDDGVRLRVSGVVKVMEDAVLFLIF
jgi:hypothetical protein